MTKCQICGHDNPAGVEYCEDCGASLAPAATPPTAPAGQATPAALGTTPGPTAPLGPEPAAPAGGPAAPAQADGTGDAAPAAPPDAQAAPATPSGATPAVPAVPSGPTTGRTARLVAQRYGAASGEEYPLLGDRLVVGRFDPETGPVDIDLGQTPEAPQLSRHHAELFREADGRWHVQDLGSTNGVFIKSAGSAAFGPRLTAPQALASGDEVAFGNARFIFRMD